MNWEECNFLIVRKHKKFRNDEEVIDNYVCKLIDASEYEFGDCDKEKCIFIKILNKI